MQLNMSLNFGKLTAKTLLLKNKQGGKPMNNKGEVWVRLKGNLYAFNTHCYTLKEAMSTYPICAKRSWIAEWWKV